MILFEENSKENDPKQRIIKDNNGVTNVIV